MKAMELSNRLCDLILDQELTLYVKEEAELTVIVFMVGLSRAVIGAWQIPEQ